MALSPVADFVCFRCEEREPGSGGPFLNLPLPKPACPNCRARRWMQRQWSGYSVTVGTRSQGEALPRMSREDIKRVDGIVRPMMEKRDAEKRFPVGLTGYEVKAVGMGNVGSEVGKLAGTVGGEQAAAMTAASVQSSINKAAGRSDKLKGQVRDLRSEERVVTAPRERTNVAAKWNPSQREVQDAAKMAQAL